MEEFRRHGSGRFRNRAVRALTKACCRCRPSRTYSASAPLTLGRVREPGPCLPARCLRPKPAPSDPAPLQETALFEVAMTTLPQGMDAIPMTLTVNYFRPPRPQPGNLLARARRSERKSVFVFSEVEIEDPQGRRIAHGSSHLRLRRIEPPPLRLLPSWRRLPSRSTPRRIPYLRQQAGMMPRLTTWQENDGDAVMRMFADGTFVAPYQFLLPVKFLTAERGHIVITLPSSEWLCRYSPSVAFASIASLANRAGWYASLTMPRRGQSFVGIGANHTVVPHCLGRWPNVSRRGSR